MGGDFWLPGDGEPILGVEILLLDANASSAADPEISLERRLAVHLRTRVLGRGHATSAHLLPR